MMRTAISPRFAMRMRRSRTTSALDHHARDCEAAIVRDRDVGVLASERPEALERRAVKLEPRLLAPGLDHLGLLPAHAGGEPGSDRLERGLLGRKAGGEMGDGILVPAAVLELGIGEQPVFQALPESLQRVHQAIDLDDIHSDSPDRHAPPSPGSMPAFQVAHYSGP